jgi:Outer membrane protein beta-barrel domain
MKNTLLLLIAFGFLSIRSEAQESRDRFVLGLKVGANYSNVYDAQGEAFNADPKYGFASGLFVSIPLGSFIGVQPEILFSQKGFTATGKILGSDYGFTRTTSYIDVPLLLAIKPIEFLTIVAGPQYSYLLQQKDVFTNGTTTVLQEQEFKNDDIRKNTLCLTGGIDINLSHFVIGARAGWDIQNNNGNGTSTTPRYKNAWLQATVGYRFYSNGHVE